MRTEVAKLIEIHSIHGSIIVGCDFDDTFFALTEDTETLERCERVKRLLFTLKEDITLCLYTVADAQSLKYKQRIMHLENVPPAYTNESPVKLGDGAKPFFNILLDDKAGLNEALEILTEFKNAII